MSALVMPSDFVCVTAPPPRDGSSAGVSISTSSSVKGLESGLVGFIPPIMQAAYHRKRTEACRRLQIARMHHRAAPRPLIRRASMDAPARLDIRSKLPAAGTTIFTVMSALATRHGAVNLGQGFPDYPIDAGLIERVDAAMRAGHNQYPLMPGVMALREAIARKVQRLYGREYDPEHEITVTTGATQAIFTTVQALAGAGDEVIVFEPAYDSYVPAVQLAGATAVTLPLTVPGFRVDWALV